MRISHRERDVAGIQRESNLVYVPDVTAGPLVAWTLTSGITLEEAALIQPAYGPVLLPKPDDAIEVLNSDATFEFENLRYSKFQIFAGDDPTSPSVNIPVTHQACSWFGCGITFPIIWDADLSRDLTLVPDFELFVRDVTSSELQPNPPLLSSFPRVVVQFDVEVTAPNLRITQLPGGGSLLSNSYFDGRQFRLFVNDSRDRLWIDQRHNPAPTCAATFCQEFGFGLPQVIQFEHGNRPRTHGDEFRPTDRMTVVTEMYFPPDQAYRGQFINFALVAVPEPATTMLIALAIGTCAISRWRTQID